jgi:cardiolipin synthase
VFPGAFDYFRSNIGAVILTLFYTLWFLLSTTAVVHLLIIKREPSSTISWFFFVVTVPIGGALLFLIFGPQRLEREAFRRKKEIARIVGSPYLALEEGTGEIPFPKAISVPVADRNILKLARRVSEYGFTEGNRVYLMADPMHALVSMQEVIQSAKHFIHLEYYIITNDEVTQQLFEQLLLAARRGVEVRILYDSIGSLSLKKFFFFRRFIQEGVKIAGFLPLSFLPQRMNVNFRNHRKILIADGKVAFTGGTNIGNQYLGRRNKSQWHDYSVRVEGPVCKQLQDVFAKDWQFTTQEDLFQPRYYPASEPVGDSAIQVLESGPDSAFYTLHQTIFLAINSAEREILLTTPYFIPDPSILASLTVAALRGVKVSLLLPLKSDAPLVRYASRSFYDTLLQAGVRIYEYLPRVLHAKLLVIDNKWTILGSANMDIRSFRLNFELNLLIYGSSVVAQAVSLFENDLKQSKEVEYESFEKRPLPQKMLENACRLFSPVM